MSEVSVDRLLGQIEEGIRGLREDVGELRSTMKNVADGMAAKHDELHGRVTRQETFVARATAVAGVFGAAVAFIGEWAWKRFTNT